MAVGPISNFAFPQTPTDYHLHGQQHLQIHTKKIRTGVPEYIPANNQVDNSVQVKGKLIKIEM